ncbi:hypothetical protein DFH08DRAFT_886947 [Mycena albidolilacea]|uniref:Uncharacterized protein n=1 Tax=Mycena albidolilacea TaxID=1033008 RepID=A0AAD7EHF8_9AGAR|nr:hypothetical protein DFH08DRAFT_886947 [Mycena albidolilacea]
MWCVCPSPSTSAAHILFLTPVFLLQYLQVVSSPPIGRLYLPHSMSTCVITECGHSSGEADVVMLLTMLVIIVRPYSAIVEAAKLVHLLGRMSLDRRRGRSRGWCRTARRSCAASSALPLRLLELRSNTAQDPPAQWAAPRRRHSTHAVKRMLAFTERYRRGFEVSVQSSGHGHSRAGWLLSIAVQRGVGQAGRG